MGLCDANNLDPLAYKDKCLNDVPDLILRPIHDELDQAAGWRDVIEQAEGLHPTFRMRDTETAKISMAVMTFGGMDTCSKRLIMALGIRGMTLQQLAECLYRTKKFEKSLLRIKTREPLKIVKHPVKQKQVYEREELLLQCEAVGFPYPRYTWFLGDTEVDQSTFSGVLRLQGMRKNQAGKYVCRVHNLDGKCVFSHACTVVVEDNPNPEPDPPVIDTVQWHPELRIVEQPKELSVCKRYSEPLRLECRASSHPPPRYQWFKDGQMLRGQTHSFLYIAQSKLTDSGQYKCVVSNGVHPSVTSEQVKVVIHDSNVQESLDIVEQPRNQTLEEGAVATLRCVANGRNGQVVYRWFHNQHELNHTEGDYTIMKGDLIIENICTRDAGDYMCLVELHHSTTGQVIRTKHAKPAKIEVKLSPTHFKMPTAKYALLVGNAAYRNESSPLPAVENDLDRIKALLEDMDFKVLSFLDLTLEETDQAVRLFCTFIIEGSYAMLYFAGHGFAECGNQYLMPCDAKHSPVSDECVCIDEIHAAVMAHKPALCVIAKDVCHRPFQNQKPSVRIERSHVVPVKGNSYMISASTLGEQAYETENGVKRGIFSKAFDDVLSEDVTCLAVKEMFDRIKEKFREHNDKYGDKYPMHPEAKENLLEHQRSLRDPIDHSSVDVEKRQQLAERFRRYCSLPPDLMKIEAEGYGLCLSTSFSLRHSNCFVMQVAVERLGKFQNCHIELHNIPLEIDGPVIKKRTCEGIVGTRQHFIFDVKGVQRLQSDLEPELHVACSLHSQAGQIQFSAPIKDKHLCRPLVSILQDWRRTPPKRLPTEDEDALTSLDTDNSSLPRNESTA